MSGPAMKWARSQKMPTTALKTMLNAIAARAGDNGTTFAAQATFAADMGCSQRHVRGLMAQLEGLGVISRRTRSKGFRGRISDEISLALHKSFDLTKIDLARICNRNKSTVASGTRVPGNNKGRTVTLSVQRDIAVNVRIPPEPGTDWNDVLIKRRKAA